MATQPHTNTAFLLTDDAFARISLHPVGASLYEVSTPDRHGEFTNIAMTTVRSSASRCDPSFAGAVLAPCAGRIRNGLLCLDGQRYLLSQNDGQHHLHGGFHNLSHQAWVQEHMSDATMPASARFHITTEAGLDGYPGNRRFNAAYHWDALQQLCLSLSATSDQPTWVNMSHHAYWNLSGNFATTALDMTLQINAAQVLLCDERYLPTQQISVEGTPFDFRQPLSVASAIAAYPNHPQLTLARGYNHAYILDGAQPAATLYHTQSGRRLRLYTDAPALMLYTGGFLGADTVLDGGLHAAPSCAIALEPQAIPLPDHQKAHDPHCLLRPGHVLTRSIRYVFDVV